MATQKEDLKSYIKSINEKVPAIAGEGKSGSSVAGKEVDEKLTTQLNGLHSSFTLLLDEIKAGNKASNNLTLDQLKFEKKGDEDNEVSKKQLDKVIAGLKEINGTLKGIKSATGGELSGSPVESKDSPISKGLPGEAENITFAENLKSFVGGAKSIGSKIMKTGSNVVGAVTDTLANPGATVKKAYGSAKDVVKGTLDTAKDILSTKADYSVEQERFANIATKVNKAKIEQIDKDVESGKITPKEAENLKKQTPELTKEQAGETYNKLKDKQEEIEKQKAVIKPYEDQGFTSPVKEKEKLTELQKQLSDLDPRVQKEKNAFSPNPISYTPGKATASALKGDEEKDREAKVSSPREVNPEADNIVTTGEIQADTAKSDLELSKQMLDTTKAQLVELKAIREALAPSTPKELTEQKSAPSSTNEKESGGGSILGDLASGAMDLLGNSKKGAGKVAGKAAGIGGKLAKFAGRLGSVAAVGLGAYTAYEGYTAAEDSKQVKMEEVQAKVDSGQMKPEEAAAARKEIGNTATVEKRGAVGEGTGMAAGSIAGATMGAAIGSIVPGAGTAIGFLAGGAIGAFAGSKAGKFIGEKVGSGINAVKGFFGSDEIGDKTKEAVTGAAPTTDIKFSEAEFAKADPDTYKKFVEFKDKRTTEIASDLARKFGRDKPNPADMQVAQSSAKVEAIEKFKKEIEASGASKSEAKVEKSSGKTADVDSKGASDSATNSIAQGAATVAGTKSESYTKIAGERVIPDQPLSDKQMAVIEMSKGMGNKYSPEVEAQYAKQKESTVVPTSTSPSAGSTVAKTSTENNDMEREASGKGGSNNTVVSNNVSSNNTTKFVPMKANPRPEYTGSSLDRYTNRITVY